MSTVPFPGFPDTVHLGGELEVQRLGERAPLRADASNLTIRRISKTHHGRTLQILGHATEYLVNSRRFLVVESGDAAADDEAVRILMRLSSSVFRDYAESVKVRRPVEDFLMGCANWLFE
jgi:hypothetical protein